MYIQHIASICHEANRQYCITLGDFSQPLWGDAPEWQVQSAIYGVEFHLANPEAGPGASHNNWLQDKEMGGWVYGAEKDPAKKLHPCMVPFFELSIAQQKKDRLFLSIVNVFRPLIKEPTS